MNTFYRSILCFVFLISSASAKELSPAEFLRELDKRGQISTIVDAIQKFMIGAHVSDDEQAKILARLKELIAKKDFEAIERERFPTVSLQKVAHFLSHSEAVGMNEIRPDLVFDGDLAEFKNSTAAKPSETVQTLFGDVKRGHAPLESERPHSKAFAQLLTSLSVKNGSSVTYHGKSYVDPGKLIRALIAHGHEISVTNERTIADFLALRLGDDSVRWPLWIDTMIKKSDGTNFTVPMGHSQFRWVITGPDIDAEITFYLGTSGAAFFPVITKRPAWTGEFVLDEKQTIYKTHHDKIVGTIEAAAGFLLRNEFEKSKMAADGYGKLGVCTDSTMIIEGVSRGTNTTFPLLRPRSNLFPLLRELAKDLNRPELDDKLDATFNMVLLQAPYDGEGKPQDTRMINSPSSVEKTQKFTIERILGMIPTNAGSLTPADPRLSADVHELLDRVGAKNSEGMDLDRRKTEFHFPGSLVKSCETNLMSDFIKEAIAARKKNQK